VRQLVQAVGEANLVEYFQRRWMNRVAAEIAVEVGVRLEQADPDTGAREQQGQHHPARSAADDAARRV
jgi:hypothetical protein